MVDYTKIADEAAEGLGGAAPEDAPWDRNADKALPRAARDFLPLNHPKYQGIAEAKGYPQGDDFSGNRLKRVHYSHEAMIEAIILNPTMSQRELAAQFNRSESWISIIMGSDAFQAALAKRRDDVTDPFLIASLEERFKGMVQQSLTVIAEKLESSRNPDLALKALDIGSKALGFGAKHQTTTTNNFVVALPPQIKDASDWVAAHAKPVGPLIDARPE